MEIKHEKQNLLQLGTLLMINISLIFSLLDKFGDNNASNYTKLFFTILTIISSLISVTIIIKYLKRIETLTIKNDVFTIRSAFGKDEFGKDELTFWKETLPLANNDKIKELILDFRGKQFVLASPNYKEYGNLISFLSTHHKDKILTLSR